jgi:hypothetical protein
VSTLLYFTLLYPTTQALLARRLCRRLPCSLHASLQRTPPCSAPSEVGPRQPLHLVHQPRQLPVRRERGAVGRRGGTGETWAQGGRRGGIDLQRPRGTHVHPPSSSLLHAPLEAVGRDRLLELARHRGRGEQNKCPCKNHRVLADEPCAQRDPRRHAGDAEDGAALGLEARATAELGHGELAVLCGVGCSSGPPSTPTTHALMVQGAN